LWFSYKPQSLKVFFIDVINSDDKGVELISNGMGSGTAGDKDYYISTTDFNHVEFDQAMMFKIPLKK